MESLTDSGLAVVHRSSRTVMYDGAIPPPQAVAWDGWPLEWAVPWTGQAGVTNRVSTVFACEDLISRTLSSFPPYLVKDAQPIKGRSWLASPEPEVYTDWTVFVKQLVNSILRRGEGFLWATARGADGWPSRFIVLNPDWITVEAIGEYRLGGDPLDPADVLHIKYQSWPGDLRGHGPLEAAALNLIGAAALEKYGADLAARGGVPWAVLKHPSKLNAAQAGDLQGGWTNAAARRDGAPAVLSGGIELQTLTLSPKEMALLDLRIFDETRICASFGVPPFLVGLPQPSGLVYSNASSLFDYFWRACLRPLAQSIASALSQWALPLGTGIEFNRDEFVRPEFGERVNAYATLFNLVDPVTGQRGITIDEMRALERLAPTPSIPEAAALISGGST